MKRAQVFGFATPLLGFAVIAALSIYLTACNRADTAPVSIAPAHEKNILRLPADAPQLAYLKVTEVNAEAIPALEPLHGRVTYNDDVTARITAPITGRVIAIHAHLGDRVSVGQPLITLLSADFAQARADAHRAQSDLNLKSKAFARAKLLFDGGVVAAKDFETAEDDLAQSRAEYERASTRLRSLGGDREQGYELRSPIAGIITERHLNVGSEIAADVATPLFVITDPKQLWIDVEVAEKDLHQIALGQQFRIQADAYPDADFTANATFIGKTLDPQTRRINIHCTLRDDSERLKPEMFVSATPLAGTTTKPHVPNAALVAEGLKTFLFVEQTPGVVQKREVTLAYRGHEESYIDTGLRAGERVVTSGALLLNAEMQGD